MWQYLYQNFTANRIIVGDFNISLSMLDRISRQKINKETADLNNTIDHLDLRYIYRTFHQTAAEYTFFSSTHGAFSSIDHMLGHKCLNKFKMIEIIPSVFSNYTGIKVEINNRKKTGKFTNM